MSDRILVVDDELDILRIVVFSLKKWGYEVATATNGQEGLGKIVNEKPDLLILDAGMPIMNGFQMLEQLRGSPDYKSIPVIMLTAHSDPRDIDRAREYGIMEYVTKPFDPMTLREKIENTLQKVQGK